MEARLRFRLPMPFHLHDSGVGIAAPVASVLDHVEAPVWPHLDVNRSLPDIFRTKSFQDRLAI